ncbi:hypothetical protein [Caldimonas brevitalea]|uniref:Outer membrane transport energization protein ExbB n=1 Tax=Caldimonas brevitalea TaxID=413882 RepID=A0A0G3BVX8_9BURK|nr:hypothetical protein [Caldimonas brevitalea]AKJ31526.1 hypothetical protein AAW51_4835 [Caldimonas brevitalea]
MMLEAGMAQVAQWLLWPVSLGVLACFAAALWALGRTLAEAWQRWRDPRWRCLPQGDEVSLDALELAAMRQLEPMRLLARMAPLLGLIATMIPLGPALAGVASGDGGSTLLGFGNAFSGVVLALAAAAIALAVHSLRRRWLLSELHAVRLARGLAQ